MILREDGKTRNIHLGSCEKGGRGDRLAEGQEDEGRGPGDLTRGYAS